LLMWNRKRVSGLSFGIFKTCPCSSNCVQW